MRNDVSLPGRLLNSASGGRTGKNLASFQHAVPLVWKLPESEPPALRSGIPDETSTRTSKSDSFPDADYSHLAARLNRMHDSQNKLILLLKEYPFGVLLASLMLTIVGAPLTTKLAAFIPGLHGQAAIAPLVLVLTLAAAYAISGRARGAAPPQSFLAGSSSPFSVLARSFVTTRSPPLTSSLRWRS